VALTSPAMSVTQKAEAIKLFADGSTPHEQEQAMLGLFRAAAGNPGEMRALLADLDHRGWNYSDLYSEMDDAAEQAEFVKLTGPAMSVDQKATAFQQLEHGLFSPTAAERQAMAAVLGAEHNLGRQE